MLADKDANATPATIPHASDPRAESTADTTVTVVIPTIGRSTLERAVRSALSQSGAIDLDVVVCADTTGALHLPDDDRVRVLRVGPGAGGNAARQAGIDIARGSLIALLDDDDRWLPDKLARQLAHVSEHVTDTVNAPWLAVTSAIVQRGRGPTVWPTRMIGPHEDFRDYMFRLRSFRMGGSFVQSSSFLFPAFLATDAVRFQAEQRIHQDWQWVLDFRTAFPGAPILQVSEPLVEYDATTSVVSNTFAVEDSVDFGRQRLADRGRLLADFLLTFPVERAFLNSDSATIRRLAFQALRAGVPTHYAACRVVMRYVQSLRRPRHESLPST